MKFQDWQLMSKENKLIPELRFPEFVKDGEWEYLYGNELFEPISNKDHNSELPILAISQEYGAIPRDMIDYKVIASEESIKSYKVVEKGDFIISLRSFQGGIEYSNYKGICSPAYIILRKKRELKDNFFKYYFKTDLYIRHLNKNLEGIRDGKMVSYNQFSEILLPYPSFKEQEKISSFLYSLDEYIDFQSEKLKTLNSHKKGLLQNLFPDEGEKIPRFRFPEFKNVGTWNEKSIQALLDENIIISHLDGNHGALYPRAEEFSDDGIPYITAKDFISGFVDFSNCKKLPKERAKKFKKGVAKNGDILFAHNATVGPVAKLITDFSFIILSTTATYYRCDNKFLINDYLKFALSSPFFVNQYTKVMSQSTRNQVPITAQRNFIIQLPNPDEQQKIASCLSALDNLIKMQYDKIEQLKEHKKGLMQRLFPII